MKKKLAGGLILSLLLMFGIITMEDVHLFTGGYTDEEGAPRQSGAYSIVRVVDGDTIIIDMDGVNERVRLIGIDTPESVHPDAERNVEYGKIAAEFTKDHLEGKEVTLEYDVQERDRYGRILAYVYLDGEMFNKILVAEGHAKVATYPPNVKYTEDFVALQEQAREEGKGLWADVENHMENLE